MLLAFRSMLAAWEKKLWETEGELAHEKLTAGSTSCMLEKNLF